ncbi:MAG: glycoside hydrolase family 113 [Streptosporangiaceae bacterium]|jgi:hypothetical protein
MTRRRLLLLGSLLAAGTVGGCSGVSHLGFFQPPSPPAAAAAAIGRAPHRQLGIDVDFYLSPGMNVPSVARTDVAYVRSLHANSLSISFPFFMDGPSSSGVRAGSQTPSPATLAVLVRTAESAGLYVSVRPLLDEHNLGISRVYWKPADPATWFASYRRFLLPYAEMAQQAHVPVLVTGVEFSQFSRSPRWTQLGSALRRVFRGTLSYSNYWGYAGRRNVSSSGVVQTVDAYKPVLQPDGTASVAQLTAAWDAYAASLPSGIVLSEVGIAAQPGAYAQPYQIVWPGEPVVPSVQGHWFTAACHAVTAEHLGGIYFWSLNFGQQLTVPPGRADPASFTDSRGAAAISACFKRLGSEH